MNKYIINKINLNEYNKNNIFILKEHNNSKYENIDFLWKIILSKNSLDLNTINGYNIKTIDISCPNNNEYLNIIYKDLDVLIDFQEENKNEGALITIDRLEDLDFSLNAKQFIYIVNGGIRIRENNQLVNQYEYFISNGEKLSLECTKENSHIVIFSITTCE